MAFDSTIYQEKKRRILGELVHEAEQKTPSSWVHIRASSRAELITYQSKGLVVAVSGSGSLAREHPQCMEAAKLTLAIADKGGNILYGGRNTGIMSAVGSAVPKQSIGILFPEIAHDISPERMVAVVNAPQPRTELLATCAPIIVIFRGGLGTLMVLMRSIVHLRNRAYNPLQLPQMVFISNYWIGLLSTMMNLGALPKEFLTELRFFDRAEEIVQALPPVA